MDRWHELERLGKLRDEGLLSDEEFAAEKRRLLKSRPTAARHPSATGALTSGWWTYAAAALAVLIVAAVSLWLLRPSDGVDESGADVAIRNTAAGGAEVQSVPTYALRSNVPGASLVRLEQLPMTTPYGGDADGYCGEPARAATLGGRLAERLGWRVVKETRFHGLDAVLIVRGFDPGLSGHCFAKDPNLAFFHDERLIGVLFAKGKNGIGMNNVEMVGDRLRVWDDLSPVGQIGLSGNDLTFDRVTGSDEVCNGRYRVPAVFGQPWSKARQVLGRAGWSPEPSTEEAAEGDRTANYRVRFPEADSCSGTGYAYCNFTLSAHDGAARLGMTTAGEDEDPLVVSYDVSCETGDSAE